MKHNDQQLGKPAVPYRADKAAIEALAGLDEGAYAYATDTDELGLYDGSSWDWLKPGGYREKLTANRTYYVRTDGNDSNDGLTNDSSGAFLTIQKAVDVIAETLDIAGYTVTVQVGDGTYTGSVSLKNVAGFASPGNLIIQGNTSTPSNVVISTTSANCFSVGNLAVTWRIQYMKLQTTTSGSCIEVTACPFQFRDLDFGSCAANHINVLMGGVVLVFGSAYTISGNAGVHWRAVPGVINCQGKTITLTGTPAFTYFASSQRCAIINVDGNTFSGSATGARYQAVLNGAINTNGGGATYLPGNAAGVTATGGQYA